MIAAIIVTGVLATIGFIGMGRDNREQFFKHGIKFGRKKS
jgi:hypothetical protein